MDGDTSWHVAAGRFILRNFQIPQVDVFSFTYQGQPWVAHEWLSEVIMALAFNAGGWRGLSLLCALAGGATALLIGLELIRRLPIRWALCVLFVIAQLLSPTALVRPHMLVWPLLAGWVLLLLHARESRRAPHLLAAVIMIVWANCHASYIIGLGLAGLFVLEAVAGRQYPSQERLRWLTFVLASVVGACVTPHGIHGFLYPFQVSGMSSLSLIGEWRPTNFRDDKLFILVAATVWGLTILNWRKANLIWLAILFGVTAMAIVHARHQSLFAIIVPISLMGLLRTEDQIAGSERAHAHLPAWIAVGVLALLAVRMAVPLRIQDNSAMPLTALAHIPEALKSRPVFNEYSYGGPLILAGIRPYIDGRGDMYGDAYNMEYARIIRGDVNAFRRVDRRWQFGWVIVPGNSGLAAKLERDPAWQRFYSDARAIVFVRASHHP